MSHLLDSTAESRAALLRWPIRRWPRVRGSGPLDRRLSGGPPGSVRSRRPPPLAWSRVGEWVPRVGERPEWRWGRASGGLRRGRSGPPPALWQWPGPLWGHRASMRPGGRPGDQMPPLRLGRLGCRVGPPSGGPPSLRCSLCNGAPGSGRPCVATPRPRRQGPPAARARRHATTTGSSGRRCCSGPSGDRPAAQPPARRPRTGRSPVTGAARPGTPGPGTRECRSRRRCLSSTPCATSLCRSRPPAGGGGPRRGSGVAGSLVSGLGGLRRSRARQPGRTGSGPPPPLPSPMAGGRCGRSTHGGTRRGPVRLPATLGHPPGGRPRF